MEQTSAQTGHACAGEAPNLVFPHRGDATEEKHTFKGKLWFFVSNVEGEFSPLDTLQWKTIQNFP